MKNSPRVSAGQGRPGVPPRHHGMETSPPGEQNQRGHVPGSRGWRSETWWVLPGIALSCVIWLTSLSQVRLEDMAGLGLLQALPALWYVAFFGLLAVYVAALLSHRAVTRSLALCHVLLVAQLFGTTSLLYDMARLSYTYKHVGVASWFLENSGVDRTIDIYHNFPGFFYLVELVHRTTTVSVLDMARWSQPVLSLVDAAMVFWVAGALTTSRRVRYGAALAFTLGDWVGQNYFAPQSLAFPGSLFVLGALLRTVPRGLAGARWELHSRWWRTSLDERAPTISAFWSSWAGTLLIVLVFAYIVVSHQLTPPTLILQTLVVCLFLRPARPWLPVLFIIIEAAWLTQAWSFLTANFRLFDVDVDNAAPPQLDTAAALPGFAVAVWAAPVFMVCMFLLTAAALMRALRRGRLAPLLVPALVALAPGLVLIAQPYGNEAIFRVYLYALPWAATIIATQFVDERTHGAHRPVAAGAGVVVLAALLLTAVYSAELTARVAPSDVAANAWFEGQTAEGSLVLPLSPGYPLRSTADYDEHLASGADEGGTLFRLPGFDESSSSAEDMLSFTQTVCEARSQGGRKTYLAVGPFSQRYVQLYGTVPTDRYDKYVALLDATFPTMYSLGGSTAYRCG